MAQADVVPAGGTASGSGGSVTYTLGQTAVQHAAGNGRHVAEGVQQPYEIQASGESLYPGITLEARVYPNPTRRSVRLRVANYPIPGEGLSARLHDGNGRLLRQFTVSGPETEIDLEPLPAATYHLRVADRGSLLKSFKIVKTKF